MAASVQSICYPLVKCVYDHPLAKIYRDPIDWVADGTPDYLDVIKTPMDLGTILRKLDSHEYVDEESVRKDVDLVWDNMITYHNMDGSYYLKTALIMKEFTAQVWGENGTVPVFCTQEGCCLEYAHKGICQLNVTGKRPRTVVDTYSEEQPLTTFRKRIRKKSASGRAQECCMECPEEPRGTGYVADSHSAAAALLQFSTLTEVESTARVHAPKTDVDSLLEQLEAKMDALRSEDRKENVSAWISAEVSKRLETTCDYVNVMNAVMDEAKRMEQEWQDAHDAEIARVGRVHAKLKDAVATKKTTHANLLDAPGPSTAVRVANEWGKSVYEKHKDTEDTGELFANLAKRVLDMKVELIGKEEEAHKAYVMSLRAYDAAKSELSRAKHAAKEILA